MKDLKDTVELMQSKDYKERFIAEYWQLKIRYEKLKNFCNKIEASEVKNEYRPRMVGELLPGEPNHDCPYDMLRNQQSCMGELLHILEIRAVIENINLEVE